MGIFTSVKVPLESVSVIDSAEVPHKDTGTKLEFSIEAVCLLSPESLLESPQEVYLNKFLGAEAVEGTGCS